MINPVQHVDNACAYVGITTKTELFRHVGVARFNLTNYISSLFEDNLSWYIFFNLHLAFISQLILHSKSHITSAQPYLLADTVVYNSLDIFRRSFLGSMTKIWQNEVPIYLRQDGHFFGWRTVLKDIQHVMCTL